jgi:pimeloyl-ACP methyl ester carboxylesterase
MQAGIPTGNRPRTAWGLSALVAFAMSVALSAFAADVDEHSLTVSNEGWILHGDLVTPGDGQAEAFALLLHKAAGDRRAYKEMARAMTELNIASLRVDLRGHGESTNLGAFDPELSRYFDASDPAVARNFELIRAGDRDIVAVLEWIGTQPDFADLPLVVVGSSYTGEEMAEAGNEIGFADVYVALAPGNFSEDSIRSIDTSAVPWLFVRAKKELPFFPALFESIRDGSEAAEIWVLPGEGHATDLFDTNPGLHLKLIEWIRLQLAD